MKIREFRTQLRKLERLVFIQNRQLGCCDSLTMAQCHLLLEIAELKSAGIVQLAISLGLDKSTLSRTALALEKNGLISRKADPSDGRSHQLRLTGEGRKQISRINREANQFYGSLMNEVSEVDQDRLTENLEELVDFLSGENIEIS